MKVLNAIRSIGGVFKRQPDKTPTTVADVKPSRKQHALAAMVCVAWMALALFAPPGLAKIIGSALFLLFFPGLLLSRLLIEQSNPLSFWEDLSLSVGLSILALMTLGLGLNTLLPLAGLAQPLSPTPLAVTIGAANLLAVGVLALKRRVIFHPLKRVGLRSFEKWLMGLSASAVALSVAGAITLNNGGSNVLTLTMLSIVCALTMILAWPRKPWAVPVYAFCIYAMSLAELLATSLRGWFITGHDIIQEYQVFELTNQHGLWSMNFLHDPYNACLSITILPTILQKLTGLSDPYVFKILIQLVFALVPVVVFLMASRYFNKVVAFLAAFIFMSFPTFMTDMPFLNRQEVAFLFFALAFLVLLNDRLSTKTKSLLGLLLLGGVIVSHYSTSYIMFGLLISCKLMETALKAMRRVRKNPQTDYNFSLPINWPAIIALTLTGYLWGTELTNTSAGLVQTLNGMSASLPSLFDQKSKVGESSYGLFSKHLSSEAVFAKYSGAITHLRTLPSNLYDSARHLAKFPVAQAHETVAPLTGVGHWLSSMHVPVYKALDAVKQGYAKLIQVLILLGLAFAVRSKTIKIPARYVLPSIALLALIVLQVLMPATVINYGVLRLIQQGLIFLALPILLAAYVMLGWIPAVKHYRLRMIAVGFALSFAFLSGLIPAITGGYPQALATSNSGFYYEVYYTHASDLAAFDWLKAHTPTGSVVDTDEFTRRRLITYDGIYARSAIAPGDISTGSYFVMGYSDTQTNKIPLYYDGALIYQTPPTNYLSDTKNVLYSNGSVEIYR